MKKSLFGAFPGARYIGKEELNSVASVIRARSPYRFYGLDLKNKVESLENNCCRSFGRKYALALSSGTAALHAALFSIGVSEGDEVIIPAYGWISNLMPILALGAIPVIVPVDGGLGLDTSLLEKAISKRTKAIIAVHMRGYPCDLKSILKISRRYDVSVIEDGAQCLGGVVGGMRVGTLGDISIFSFQYNKLVTCGEGGMLLTNRKNLYNRAYRFHDLGMFRHAGKEDPRGYSAIASFGLNYRMSELQAAFLIPQLRKTSRILRGLKISHKNAVQKMKPLCDRFLLTEIPLPLNSKANHAFLCLKAENGESAAMAQKALCRLGIPAHRAHDLDGHNFKIWKDYLVREKKRYRLLNPRKSEDVLERSIFIEMASVAMEK
ncbi:MAG: aminotransferase class V-fold PLP-dependent enzyme [Candidatus Omnitrophica bacterium]|nr:aminotransferase class V-fold PLP-dependent enzyme [Candidatus Omnitrophota bacterium]